MTTLTVPNKSYRRILAFALHQSIKDDCLDEFLSTNDISDVLNITIEQTSVLGLLALKSDDRGMITLLNKGAVPINTSYDPYDRASTDLVLILQHCSPKVYQMAVDRLIDQSSANILNRIVVSIFGIVHTADNYCMGFKYLLSKLDKVINYQSCIESLIDVAYELYQKKRNPIGFQILFEYSIQLGSELNSILESEPDLKTLYDSYQIPIKEPVSTT